jgi:RNA polymerase sigma-70 factor (ECF subfamily)
MSGNLDLEQLAQQCYARIWRAALLLAGESHEADDLAQETFVQAALGARRFRGDSDPFVWLYGILLNVHRKRRRRLGAWLRAMARWWERRPSEGGLPAAGSGAWRERLWSVVHELPLPQRQAIVLRFAEGLSYPEIAQAVGCPVGTAKTRVFHGLRGLRERLKRDASVLEDL